MNKVISPNGTLMLIFFMSLLGGSGIFAQQNPFEIYLEAEYAQNGKTYYGVFLSRTGPGSPVLTEFAFEVKTAQPMTEAPLFLPNPDFAMAADASFQMFTDSSNASLWKVEAQLDSSFLLLRKVKAGIIGVVDNLESKQQNEVEGRLISYSVEGATGPVVYPNPANAELWIDAGESRLQTVILLNVTGQICRTMEAGKYGQVHMEVADLPAGMYFLRTQSNEGAHSLKVWVRH